MTSAHWRRALLPLTATIQHAVQSLNDSGLQIAVVVAEGEVLVGTVTDGDIRRGLLRGLTLDCTIDSIIHREAMVVPSQLGREMVLRLMRANEIHALPVVDETRRVTGLHVLKELLAPTARPNPIVIMAGGKGARLGPQTEACPKPLLPVRGKPMLEHIIERAHAEGFRRFVIAIHYLGHMIEDYFGDGSRWHVQIEYLREAQPLGTAGAIGLMTPLPDVPIIVANGDVLTDVRYTELLDFHAHHGTSATMAVRMHEWQHPFGVVQTKGVDIVGFEEKPVLRSHVNAGIYVLDPRALGRLNPGEYCDMTALFDRLREAGERTIVYPMHEPWMDLGLPDDLERARMSPRPT